VLVVDDEPNISALLSATLRLVAFDVRVAESGHGALVAIEEFEPDLVVLDVMLPDLDGFDVARRLRGEGRRLQGASTITQQLARNIFLSNAYNFGRKGREIVLALAMERKFSKRQILELYLNSVEWGQGVFGAQAASQRYFHLDASALGPMPAAELAVMLPAPKRFEKRPGSPYVVGRAATVSARMNGVALP
jgi:membrane peptidoglycan carboxypeptidase